MQNSRIGFPYRKLLLHIFVGLLLFSLDEGSKYLASKHLVFEYHSSDFLTNEESLFYENESKKIYKIKKIPILSPIISLEYVQNPNIGFSFLSFLDQWVSAWKKFIIVSLVQIMALLWMFILFYTKKFTYYWSLTLATSGGLGNIVNRLYCGYVVDFIKISFPKMQFADMMLSWPVFNLADIYITLGGILLIGDILQKRGSTSVAAPPETLTRKDSVISGT